MAAYQLIAGSGSVRRASDGATIPENPDLGAWREYQAWLAIEGNTPDEPDPAPAPSPGELYEAALGAGIGITSASTPALDGTYAIDAEAWGEITGQMACISAGIGLPLDAGTVAWPDTAGDPHPFTAAKFLDFAKVVRDYLFGLRQTRGLLDAGQEASWPANPSEIG